MSRPRKKPSIEEQMRSLIAQAVNEKRWDMVHGLIAILRSETVEPEKKKEE